MTNIIFELPCNLKIVIKNLFLLPYIYLILGSSLPMMKHHPQLTFTKQTQMLPMHLKGHCVSVVKLCQNVV